MNLYGKMETFIVCMVFALFGYLHWCSFMRGTVFYIFLIVLNVLKKKTKKSDSAENYRHSLWM